MQRFTSWAEIEPTATPAEMQLKNAVLEGKTCILGNGTRQPADISPIPVDIHIRADVLRFFILGTDPKCMPNEAGIDLIGAYVSGFLNLNECEVPRSVRIRHSVFDCSIYSPNSKWRTNLWLDDSFVPGLDLSGASVGGQLSLMRAKIAYLPGRTHGMRQGRAAFLQKCRVGGAVLFNNAQFDGEANLEGIDLCDRLNCSGTHFRNSEGRALRLDGSQIAENADFSRLVATGSTELNNAQIGGHLKLNNATFEKPLGTALSVTHSKIKREFVLWSTGFTLSGKMDVTATSVGSLKDNLALWPNRGDLKLDGFRYQRIEGSIRAKERLPWLTKGDTWHRQFFPQPYKQLAKVLDDMGHESDAREVLYTLSRKLSEQRCTELRREIAEVRQSAPRMGLAIAKRLLLSGEHLSGALLRWVVGYGYKPFRSLAALTGLIAACWIMTIGTWHAGDFAPNSSIVLASPEWAAYNTADKIPEPPNPAGHWSDHTIPGRDWESFHSLAYAADVVIPIIDFGQTEAWAPSKERGWWGTSLWWLRWIFTTAGWIVTALGAAALTGIIRRE